MLTMGSKRHSVDKLERFLKLNLDKALGPDKEVVKILEESWIGARWVRRNRLLLQAL